MHRKHYVKLADILRQHYVQLDDFAQTSQGADALYYLVEDIATLCESDNPNFDRERFWSAVKGVK